MNEPEGLYINRPNPYRWETILAVLSLDVASPFVEDMGLRLERPDDFRAGLRKIILEFRQREATRGNVEDSFLQAISRWSTQEFSQPFTALLWKWGENIFQFGGDEGARVFLWSNIIRRGGLNGEKDHQPPPQFVTKLRGVLAKRAKPAVNRIQPATAWDKEVYHRQQYDQFRNAMELVQATISYYDFITSWREALATTGSVDVDIEEVKKWGIEEALILGMPLGRIGNPGEWGKGVE